MEVQEDWRPIRNFLKYDVSNLGRVRNSKTERILRTYVNEFGYLQVCLRKNNRSYVKRVHRLVAEAFLSLSNNYEELDVRFLDGDKANVYVDNLEWCRQQDVEEHAGVAVRIVETGEEFSSIRACAKAIGLHRNTIMLSLDNPHYRIRGCDYHFERI